MNTRFNASRCFGPDASRCTQAYVYERANEITLASVDTTVSWPFLTVGLAVIGSGLANGWASPYLAQLTSTEGDVPLRLTDTEASWVASLLNLGRLVGALLSPLCQGKVVSSLSERKLVRSTALTHPLLCRADIKYKLDSLGDTSATISRYRSN